MIAVQGLTRRFGSTVAVDGLTFEVAEGEILGLLGPNGAGKTTTIRMLAGLIGVSSGHAQVCGVEVTDASAGPRLRRLVGVLPEEVGLYGDLSAARTLDFFGRLYDLSAGTRATRAEELLSRLGLWERRDAPASSLSKGLKQRLAMARALVHNPPVILLDEPTANLDPEVARTVREFLLELRGTGHTVVINTHRLEEAERLCDRVGVLRTRLLRVGRPGELTTGARQDRVTVDLESVPPELVEALQRLGVREVTVEVGRIEAVLAGGVSVADVVVALVEAGGRITRVSPTQTLEDAYLDIVEQLS